MEKKTTRQVVALAEHPQMLVQQVHTASVTRGIGTPDDQVLLTLYLREESARASHEPIDKIRFSLELTDGRTVPVEMVSRLSQSGRGIRCDIRPKRTIRLSRQASPIAHVLCQYRQHVHRVPHS